MDFTPLVRGRFLERLQEHLRYEHHAAAVQQGELVWLVEKAALTQMGRRYDFSTVRTYEDFARRVPLHNYDALRPFIMRMEKGEAGVLWPGVTRHYAQSSGTSEGRSKHIPVTADSLKRNHYRGASDVVSHYLNLNQSSRIFSGKALILGGSFASDAKVPRGVRVGDLSATLIDQMNPLANLFRVPRKDVALMADWNEKLPALVDAAVKANVTNLSGVPSWFLTLLKQVLARTGATCIHEIWPHLEVFFHGGISFEPYRAQYEAICDMSRMHFLDTYNASEGFFAVQSDWASQAMLLLLDVGVFYEFIPLDETDSSEPDVLPIWEIEAGKTYELVITSCNGLWRYRLGDTVRIEQLNPVKITIAGRTRSFINAFGEELMVHQAEQAVSRAAAVTHCHVLNYTAAPVFATEDRRGRHQWLVEFDDEPAQLEQFARQLDHFLQEACVDYQAKRAGSIFLDAPEVLVARRGLFDQWLASTGKLGGQRKVPRLANDRHLMDDLLSLNA
ncbi:MAG: GH3 auxin-responsive promoter family protein [Muribaculaceae bacterium]|nr:GH3 auxin-responsive promoter family protein [Muribaculaceae bacterium]